MDCHGGKKLEIKKSEAKDLWGAKQLAIKKLKVPKSKVGLMAIDVAYESISEIAGFGGDRETKTVKSFEEAQSTLLKFFNVKAGGKTAGVETAIKKLEDKGKVNLSWKGKDLTLIKDKKYKS